VGVIQNVAPLSELLQKGVADIGTVVLLAVRSTGQPADTSHLKSNDKNNLNVGSCVLPPASDNSALLRDSRAKDGPLTQFSGPENEPIAPLFVGR